jgi:hypothetical protein
MYRGTERDIKFASQPGACRRYPPIFTQSALQLFAIYSYLSFRFCSLVPVNFDSEFFGSCIAVAQQHTMGSLVSPATDFTKAKDAPENIPPQSLLISDSYPGAFSDFYGFPSHPVCVYRTGDEWPVPKGPQAQRVPREVRPVCNHPIQAVWCTLGEQVYEFLDSLEVLWSTIDPVRFAEEEGEAGPLYLWVGVDPGSLSLEVAKAAAVGCKKILGN